ncbi:MAG: hypothetical protein J6Z44_05600, partial [Bacteroidales bacterium]|nr:hypothetical protein [Bacteroidales bacterium]
MQRIISRLSLFIALFISVSVIFAQESPVKWNFKSVKVNDSVAELQFTAAIQSEWHLYAQKKGEGQIELPLVFNFTASPQYERIGKVIEPTPQSDYDDILDAHSNFYTKQVTFKQRVKVKDNEPFAIKGKLEGQACREGRCTPVEQKFSFDIKGFDNVKASAEPEVAEEPETDSSATASIAPAPEPQDAAKADSEKEESLWR